MNLKISKTVSFKGYLDKIVKIAMVNLGPKIFDNLDYQIKESFFGERIDVVTKKLNEVPVEKLSNNINDNTVNVSINSMINIENELAQINIIFPFEAALLLVGLLKGKEKFYEVLLEEDVQLLRKFGQEIISNITESFSHETKLPIIYTSPKITFYNRAAANDIVNDTFQEAEEVFCWLSEFKMEEEEFTDEFHIMLTFQNPLVVISEIKSKIGIWKERIVDPAHYFHLQNGKTIKNLKELFDVIALSPDYVFVYHHNDQKSDFFNWIKFVIKDDDLATLIAETKNKDQFLRVLEEYEVIINELDYDNMLSKISEENNKLQEAFKSVNENYKEDLNSIEEKVEEIEDTAEDTEEQIEEIKEDLEETKEDIPIEDKENQDTKSEIQNKGTDTIEGLEQDTIEKPKEEDTIEKPKEELVLSIEKEGSDIEKEKSELENVANQVANFRKETKKEDIEPTIEPTEPLMGIDQKEEEILKGEEKRIEEVNEVLEEVMEPSEKPSEKLETKDIKTEEKPASISLETPKDSKDINKTEESKQTDKSKSESKKEKKKGFFSKVFPKDKKRSAIKDIDNNLKELKKIIKK